MLLVGRTTTVSAVPILLMVVTPEREVVGGGSGLLELGLDLVLALDLFGGAAFEDADRFVGLDALDGQVTEPFLVVVDVELHALGDVVLAAQRDGGPGSSAGLEDVGDDAFERGPANLALREGGDLHAGTFDAGDELVVSALESGGLLLGALAGGLEGVDLG